METDQFKCPLCFFKSTIHSELMKHYFKVHKQDEDFEIICRECDKKFKKLRSFQQHLLRKHPNEGIAEQNNAVPRHPHQVNFEIDQNDLMDQDHAEGYKGFLLKLKFNYFSKIKSLIR